MQFFFNLNFFFFIFLSIIRIRGNRDTILNVERHWIQGLFNLIGSYYLFIEYYEKSNIIKNEIIFLLFINLLFINYLILKDKRTHGISNVSLKTKKTLKVTLVNFN